MSDTYSLSDSFLLRFLLILVIPLALLVVIGLGVYYYVDFLPTENMATVIGAFLSASSILFGFTALSLRFFSDKIEGIHQKTSDIAKEFCDLYRMVQSDKTLSSKQLSYKTKIYKAKIFSWGKDFGSPFFAPETAIEAIKSAYIFLLQSFRFYVKLCKNIVYILYALALISLSASIMLSLLSYAPAFIEYTLSPAIMCFLFSIPIILFGWIISNRLIVPLDDTLFNVRQTIFGGLAGILPPDYETKRY